MGEGCLFEGLPDAAAGLIEPPAVIAAANAALFNEAIAKIGAAMRTLAIDQAVAAAEVLVEHQIFAEQADRLGGAGLRAPPLQRPGASTDAAAHPSAYPGRRA